MSPPRCAGHTPYLAISTPNIESITQMPYFDKTIGGILELGPKIPGTRCPTCALDGREVWVIPGRSCGYCGTPCDAE